MARYPSRQADTPSRPRLPPRRSSRHCCRVTRCFTNNDLTRHTYWHHLFWPDQTKIQLIFVLMPSTQRRQNIGATHTSTQTLMWSGRASALHAVEAFASCREHCDQVQFSNIMQQSAIYARWFKTLDTAHLDNSWWSPMHILDLMLPWRTDQPCFCSTGQRSQSSCYKQRQDLVPKCLCDWHTEQ